jgi:hypothetical protein
MIEHGEPLYLLTSSAGWVTGGAEPFPVEPVASVEADDEPEAPVAGDAVVAVPGFLLEQPARMTTAAATARPNLADLTDSPLRS